MINQILDRVLRPLLDDGRHHVLEDIVDFLLFDVCLDLLLELHFGLPDVQALSCLVVLFHFRIRLNLKVEYKFKYLLKFS